MRDCPYQCTHCGTKFDEKAPERLQHPWPHIPGLADRVQPGDVVPVGQCPVCGWLVYPVKAVAKAESHEIVVDSVNHVIRYTVILDLGEAFDHSTSMETVSVLAATPPEDRTSVAANRAKELAAQSVNVDADDAIDQNLFKVVAIIEGIHDDIQRGDE